MYEHPLVSVIVVVRNGERFIAEALQSIYAQTYRPIEILVVDGQSTDRTAEIAVSFPGIHFLCQPDKGVANAYNYGLTHAQGELIAFLSHDDKWMLDKLSIQVDYLLSHHNLQFSVCQIKYFEEANCHISPGFRYSLVNHEVVAFIPETLVARRCLFDRIGQFDPSLSTAEDVDWFSRVFDAGISGYIAPEVLVEKRIHDSNLSICSHDNNQHLLTALRRSIIRKRQQ